MNNKNSGNGLTERLGSIPEKSRTVRTQVLQTEDQLTDIQNIYDEVISHADEGIPPEYQWDHSPDERRVEDKEISIEGDLEKLETEELSHSDPDTIEIEGGTFSEYLDRITSKIEEKDQLRSDLQERIDSVNQLSEETVKEFLDSTTHLQTYDTPGEALEGSWGEKLDQRLSFAEGKRETQRILEDVIRIAETEKDALKQDLIRSVNSYVEEAYQAAVEISEQLGGRGRPHSRELDLLADVSRSRAAILENRLEPEEYEHSNSTTAEQSDVLQKGKEALEKQAYLIAQYASELDTARNSIQNVIGQAEGKVDEDDLQYARNQLKAMQEGYRELGNAVTEECYDSLSEAVENIMRQGLSDEEEFSIESEFSFENLPYLGSTEVESNR